jgi:hypothetical protein
VLVIVPVIVIVIVLVHVLFVLVWWCGRGLGGRWHFCTPAPKEPEERGANFAHRVVVFGRSVARAGSVHPVTVATGETGQRVPTRIWIFRHSRHSSTRIPRFVSGSAHGQTSFQLMMCVECLTAVD